MTISPPAKVNLDAGTTSNVTILTSGIDRLVMAIDVEWNEESLFEYFKELKEMAKINDQEIPGSIGKESIYIHLEKQNSMQWRFLMKFFQKSLTQVSHRGRRQRKRTR